MLTIDAAALTDIAQRYSGAAYLAQTRVIAAIGPVAGAALECRAITTPLRIAHFLAQACVECEDFSALVEAGPVSYFHRYDGRMGNTHPGDGYRFRGRGVLQLTGRDNYARYGGLTGLDLVNYPDLAATPVHAFTLACAYWQDLDLNGAADLDDVAAVTQRINGGLNGLAQRRAALARAKATLARLSAAALAAANPAASDPVLHLGDQTGPVIALQRLLRSAGYPVAVDGDFGPGTVTAVALFQAAKCPPSDGIVGPATWASLRDHAAATA